MYFLGEGLLDWKCSRYRLSGSYWLYGMEQDRMEQDRMDGWDIGNANYTLTLAIRMKFYY